ncbi:hypothetical protein SAMD00019534_017150 [Acytostelium subglobosum LB1]|uniref:hypothetical protein n=1 Tax=Acytostelium subglobosum LB1 TaxID=1410327 RepID=UPI00064515DC|nr:hypothetical protein SAMD00019534_017150 [Acytostelium subglobosum LB1]GAM18540.1 hypothetical protein SAMD00019534_017150 [Acytostelium subglobosum LB1]|eukprot:XP_012757760.1 hypothetical protein SAMD00019534_017150 [Acytostelium subglobosum LB1]
MQSGSSQFSYYFQQQQQSVPFGQKIDIALQLTHLSPYTKSVLVKVYTTLSFCVASAFLGCLFSMFIYQPNILLLIVADIAALIYFATRPIQQTMNRFRALMVVGFIVGISLTPLVNYSIDIDPSVVVSAITTTAAVFLSFTFFSLMSDKRSFLYFGGTLTSLCVALIFMTLSQFFLHSQSLDKLIMCLYAVVLTGFLVFDTQFMIYRIENGNDDYILHAFGLFMDLIDIFRFILRILAENKKKEKKDRN